MESKGGKPLKILQVLPPGKGSGPIQTGGIKQFRCNSISQEISVLNPALLNSLIHVKSSKIQVKWINTE